MSLNVFAIVFFVVDAALLLLLPRRWAPLALLVGACYMTMGQGLTVGPFHFPIIRMLIAIGLIRVLIRGERFGGGMNEMDWLMLVWLVLALTSSFFHKDPSSAFIFRLGLIFNTCGIYFLFRIFCQSIEDIRVLYIYTAILLMPVAVAMFYEKLATYNLFSVLGGVPIIPEIREGNIRASGPFAHSILAGTVGAVCLPFMVGLWQQNKIIAIVGFLSCLTMVISSASSGPILSSIVAITALFMWRFRQNMRLVRWIIVMGYIALDIVMKAPAYYIISRINVVGGSTGWHRAALIESAINHINEWWMWGTDYTRDWMPTGVSWSEDHTDITNYYLHFGVVGGLPLMLVFIVILSKGFSYVGKTMWQVVDLPSKYRFMLWTLGASLFVHAVTFLSVSIFDQSFLFLYMNLALISSAWSVEMSVKKQIVYTL